VAGSDSAEIVIPVAETEYEKFTRGNPCVAFNLVTVKKEIITTKYICFIGKKFYVYLK
jgi:hypothetical protein